MSDVLTNHEEGLSSGETSFWFPLDPGVVKVNFDGSFIKERLVASVGILMHKDDGSFLFTLAELGVAWFTKCLATCIGLLKTHELGLKKIALEGDCKNLIGFLLGDNQI